MIDNENLVINEPTNPNLAVQNPEQLTDQVGSESTPIQVQPEALIQNQATEVEIPVIDEAQINAARAQTFREINDQPLISADPFNDYDAYVKKCDWNYHEIMQRGSLMKTSDLAVQSQLYLSDHKDYRLDHITNVINNFIKAVDDKIQSGQAVKLADRLILDCYKFQNNQTAYIVHLPHSKLPMAVNEWNKLNSVNDENLEIIDTYLKMLMQRLANGHECEFFHQTILVQNRDQQISIYSPAKKEKEGESTHGSKKRSKKS